jgi:Acyltransferase family
MLNTDDSLRINLLRFPLIVGVIYIHNAKGMVQYANGSTTVGHSVNNWFLSVIQFLISAELASIAVPVFFLLAGYLFFYGADWSVSSFFNKLKNRVRSLLVPFLFWNILTLVLIAVGQSLSFTHEYFSGKNPFISDFLFQDYIRYIFGIHVNPISYQFWFIRDLMMIVFISPLFYLAIKKGAYAFILFLLVIWFFFNSFSISPAPVGCLFFAIGAWFAIEQKSLFMFDCYKKTIYVVYAVILSWILYTQGQFPNLHKIGILFGVASALCITLKVSRMPYLRSKLNQLAGASFFVFAAHEPLLSALRKIAYSSFQPESDLSIFTLYLCIPIVLILLLVFIHQQINQHLPNFTRIITGGR